MRLWRKILRCFYLETDIKREIFYVTTEWE